MPRARLASFDDCTITVASPFAEKGASSDVNGVMSSSSPLPGSYSDDEKLIESRTDQYFGDYNTEHTYEPPSTSDFPTSAFRDTSIEEETWLAPFHDYDLHHDPVNAHYQHDLIAPAGEDLRHDADRQHLSPRDRLFDAAIKVQAVVKLTRVQRLKKRARWLTKKVIVFVLSHVGLTTLVGLYAVAGGFIFQRLERNMGFMNAEAPQAYRVVAIRANSSFPDRTSFEALRVKHVEDLWNLTLSLNVLQPEVWKEIASADLELFEKDIYQAMLHLVRDVAEPGLPVTTTTARIPGDTHSQPLTTDWTYSSALLFAVTVITTIGYGDTVPRSWEAKIVCIVYAVFGIPLTLLCLANIGSLLASVYRFTWKHASHLALVVVRAPERNKPLVRTSQVRVPVWVSLMTMIVYILGGAAIFSEWENWTFLEGSYFCFITLSTIGFGDYVPGKDTETLDSNVKRVVCALYLLFGLALLSMIFQLIQDSVTIVVGRYASFLGLSEAQIERDILEPEVTVGRKTEPADGCILEDNVETKDEVAIGDTAKTIFPVSVPEFSDKEVLDKHCRFDDATNRMYGLQRVRSLPIHRTPRKAYRNVSRLYSVPEEKVLRDISCCLDKPGGSLDVVIQTNVGDVATNGRYRKHSLPSVLVDKEKLQA
ncbi:unnamed protein product [Candidula unifasciata]|uniref:Potassium channel domain-containing protein n=1 Tax=Candidula unifasciata TaxID=100452 RepID=A0A8S3YEN1_9EUPU|nr:unnamed protein product [Candidula unifasciata]